MKITISFKNTTSDKKIFNYYNKFENGEKSEIIKKALKQYMEVHRK